MRKYLRNHSLFFPRNYDNRLKPLAINHRNRLQSNLHYHRNSTPMSQSDLAHLAGVSRKTISAIETGAQWPSLVVALKISAALDTDINEIFKLREIICCATHISAATRQANGRLRP